MLNLGTPTSDRVEVMIQAGRQANRLRKPVIFDPVGAGASLFRDSLLRRILSDLHVQVIRGNRAEIGSLAGAGGKIRGVSAAEGPLDTGGAAREVCLRTGASWL